MSAQETKEKFDLLLKSAKTISQENLISDEEEIPNSSGTYILDKFFNENERPVPKPRTKIHSDESQSSRSGGTFKVPTPPEPALEEIGDVIVHESPTNSQPGKVRIVSASGSSSSEKGDEVSVEEPQPKPRKHLNDSKIVEIVIHKTDKLQLNSYVTHPVVKMSIVDVNSGKYYLKSDKSRQVVFYYENEQTDYILPVMTQCYNLQEKRSLFPSWQERILLNEDCSYLQNSNAIFFFEILDFPVSHTSNYQKLDKNCHKGWHRIAFAFFKPLDNFNRKLRLQLYYYKHLKPNLLTANTCQVYELWKQQRNKLRKYPSTLHITISEVMSPSKVIEAFRSKTPLQKEITTTVVEAEVESSGKTDLEPFKLKLSGGGKTALPNKCAAKLNSFENGCFICRFSNGGEYLACAVQIGAEYYIVVYNVMTFEESRKCTNHRGLIYSINWSKDDHLIISASADNTVSIWDFTQNQPQQILPHPSFVYATAINSENRIATGCYDKIVRIWLKNEENYELKQELESHKSFITSICFNKKSSILYSSDAAGAILEWTRNSGETWSQLREISILDLKGVTINQIILFPNDKKLLVHSRDSTLRIVSLKNGCVLHWLQGALNRRTQSFCSISRCGTFVLCGSENGLAIIWDAKTGQDVVTYDLALDYKSNLNAIHCAQFNPVPNLLAFSHYGGRLPILIYEHDGGSTNLTNVKVTRSASNVNKSDKLKPLVDVDKKYSFNDILKKMDSLLKQPVIQPPFVYCTFELMQTVYLKRQLSNAILQFVT